MEFSGDVVKEYPKWLYAKDWRKYFSNYIWIDKERRILLFDNKIKYKKTSEYVTRGTCFSQGNREWVLIKIDD